MLVVHSATTPNHPNSGTWGSLGFPHMCLPRIGHVDQVVPAAAACWRNARDRLPPRSTMFPSHCPSSGDNCSSTPNCRSRRRPCWWHTTFCNTLAATNHNVWDQLPPRSKLLCTKLGGLRSRLLCARHLPLRGYRPQHPPLRMNHTTNHKQ